MSIIVTLPVTGRGSVGVLGEGTGPPRMANCTNLTIQSLINPVSGTPFRSLVSITEFTSDLTNNLKAHTSCLAKCTFFHCPHCHCQIWYVDGWEYHLITPAHQCLRASTQISGSMPQTLAVGSTNSTMYCKHTHTHQPITITCTYTLYMIKYSMHTYVYICSAINTACS